MNSTLHVRLPRSLRKLPPSFISDVVAGSMDTTMLGSRHGDKVLGAIVGLLAVNVVNVFGRVQAAAIGLFPHKPMLKNVSTARPASLEGTRVVGRVNQNIAVVRLPSLEQRVGLPAGNGAMVEDVLPWQSSIHAPRLARVGTDRCPPATTAKAKPVRRVIGWRNDLPFGDGFLHSLPDPGLAELVSRDIPVRRAFPGGTHEHFATTTFALLHGPIIARPLHRRHHEVQ